MAERQQEQPGKQQGVPQQAPEGKRDLKGALKKLQDRAKEAMERQQAANRQEIDDIQKVIDRIGDQNEQNRKELSQRATSLKSDIVEQFRSTRDVVRQRQDKMKAEIGDRKSAHDLKAAERRAERAEDYAAEVIAWVSDGIDEAEIAVLEAVAARTDVEKMRQGGGKPLVH